MDNRTNRCRSQIVIALICNAQLVSLIAVLENAWHMRDAAARSFSILPVYLFL